MAEQLVEQRPQTGFDPPWRRVVAAVAVLASVPYAVLKVAWLAGSSIGLSDDRLLHDPVMATANALTLVMMLAGGALAQALVRPFGLRLPAWLVLTPAYVGSGLLGGVLLAVPVQLLLFATGWGDANGAANVAGGEGPIDSWVYLVVYTGFAVLGLCLFALFPGYARRRWLRPGGWLTPMSGWRGLDRRERGIAVALGLVMVALVVAGLAVSGLRGGAIDLSTLIAGAGCLAGLIMLAGRRPERAGVAAFVLAFTGSAVVATWGLYLLLMQVVPNPLSTEPAEPVALALLAVQVINAALTLVALRRLRPGVGR